jgi:hypothetical protein
MSGSDDFATYVKHKSAELAAKHNLTPVTF